jgi:pyruvate kinase
MGLATQMLESMVANPMPTRAEAADVFNAILDGTDALMLSGETASGEHPIECVQMMDRIARRAEPHYDHGRLERHFLAGVGTKIDTTDAIAHAVASLAAQLRPAAIVTTSTSGQTPRLVSKFRPRVPILCATWSRHTHRQMAVVWGVESTLVGRPATTEASVETALNAFSTLGRLHHGDEVILTAGVPAGVAGKTNLIETLTVKHES